MNEPRSSRSGASTIRNRSQPGVIASRFQRVGEEREDLLGRPSEDLCSLEDDVSAHGGRFYGPDPDPQIARRIYPGVYPRRANGTNLAWRSRSPPPASRATGSRPAAASTGIRRPRSSTRMRSSAGRAGWPRAARSRSTPASTPAARRRTSSSSGTRSARSGSAGARSTSRSTRPTSKGSARRSIAHLDDAEAIYVVDAFAGADPEHRINVRVVTDRPYHALFAKTMFIEPDEDELAGFEPDALVLHAPEVEADPDEDGTRCETFVVLHPTRSEVLIGGTYYARRDQEVDLLAHERSPSARRRPPDALLGERLATTATSRSSSGSRAPARRRFRPTPSGT